MSRRAFSALLLMTVAGRAQEAQPLPKAAPQEGLALRPGAKQASPEVKAFLAARALDITAGRKAPHQGVLEALSASADPTERMWALGRRVEAGDLGAYPDYAQAMVLHIRATVQSHSGFSAAKAGAAAGVIGPGAPEAFHISPRSPFWKSLARTLEQDPAAEVDQGLYAVWCYNTLPGQRDLIYKVARHILSKVSLHSRGRDPWNDPRFWIVTDWAISWGTAEDFDRLEQFIPEGPARSEFAKRFEELKKIQSYLPCLQENQARREDPEGAPSAMGAVPPGMADQLKTFQGASAFDFASLKVKAQPTAPRYPEEAKGRRLMADMQVDLTVDPTGTPCMVRVRPGPFLAFFAPTCLRYSEGWRFQPATLKGAPVYARFRLTMPFRLW